MSNRSEKKLGNAQEENEFARSSLFPDYETASQIEEIADHWRETQC